MLRISMLSLALLCIASDAFGQGRSDTEAVQAIENIWSTRNFYNVTYGYVEIVGGPAGTVTGRCGDSRISEGHFKVIQAAQQVGLVTIGMDQSQQQFNRGQSFSWDQLLAQTTQGVMNKARVSLTPLGMEIDRSSLPPDIRLQNCLRISTGTYKINTVVKSESYKKGVNDYRVLFINYTVEYNPQFHKIVTLLGSTYEKNRKAIVLLRFDPFQKNWSMIAFDTANANSPFTTNHASTALEAAK